MHNRTAENESKYKSYRNKLTNIIRLSEKQHYSKLLEQHRKNIKETWKILNEIMNRNKQKTCGKTEYFINDKNKKISNPLEIANGFNNFFC